MDVAAPYTNMTCWLSFLGTVMPPISSKAMHARTGITATFSPWAVSAVWSKANMKVYRNPPDCACSALWETPMDIPYDCKALPLHRHRHRERHSHKSSLSVEPQWTQVKHIPQ